MHNGGEVTLENLKRLSKDQKSAIVEYLRECPLYETAEVGDKDYLLVHSGLDNFSRKRNLSDYTSEELLWARPDLNDIYYDDVITVFGHTPTCYYGKEYKGRILRTKTWMDIDVGAGHGEEAVLLRLDDGSEYSL